MIDYIKALFDISKLPAKFFLLFSLVSGFILFADRATLETFHLENFELQYGVYVGVCFLTSIVMVFINAFIWGVEKYNRSVRKRKRRRNVVKFIKTITPMEASVLREFLVPNMRTISAPLDDPTISGMLHKKILHLAMSIDGRGTMLQGMTATISLYDDVRDRLNWSDVGLSTEPTEEDLGFINSHRPNWVSRYGGFYIEAG